MERKRISQQQSGVAGYFLTSKSDEFNYSPRYSSIPLTSSIASPIKIKNNNNCRKGKKGSYISPS